MSVHYLFNGVRSILINFFISTNERPIRDLHDGIRQGGDLRSLEYLLSRDIQNGKDPNIFRRFSDLFPGFSTATNSKQTPRRCECKICFFEYSTTRIPRILRECGHTICEECAGQLLETCAIDERCSMSAIVCPFCREGTVVLGTVQQMPWNYALMEVIGI